MSHTFSQFHFQGQRENEQVIRVIHRHWFHIVLHLGTVFLLSFLVIGGIFFLPFLFPEIDLERMGPFLSFAQNTLFLFLWLYGFLVWIDYYFDVWIVTNERIVNIEQKGLFTRHVSELRFARVQDVTSSVDGFVQTMFNFGDVYVQTAAEQERFLFRQVADPFAIKDQVMRLAREATRDDMRAAAQAFEAERK